MKKIYEVHFFEFKPDGADIFGIITYVPFSMLYMLFISVLPTYLFLQYHSYRINEQNILPFYLVSLFNVLYIDTICRFSENTLYEYNIEYKQRKDGSVSLVKRWMLLMSTIGGISNRFLISLVYITILILSHLEELNILIINNELISTIIKVNKYSIVILFAFDVLLKEAITTKTHFKYKIKKWLELFYMKRLKIMQKETLRRIDELFDKKEYKRLFFEFGYVLDTMYDELPYDEYLKICSEIDRLKFKERYKELST